MMIRSKGWRLRAPFSGWLSRTMTAGMLAMLAVAVAQPVTRGVEDADERSRGDRSTEREARGDRRDPPGAERPREREHPGMGPEARKMLRRWQRLSRQKWREIERRAAELSRRHNAIEAERNRRLDELKDLKRDYEPGQLGPEAVRRRQRIERLLGQLHEQITEERRVVGEAAIMLGMILRQREQVIAILEAEIESPAGDDGQQPGATADQDATARRKEARQALEQADDGAFAAILLGDVLGMMALRVIPPEMGEGREGPSPWWDPSNGRGGGRSTGIGQGLRERFKHLDEIERRQGEIEGAMDQLRDANEQSLQRMGQIEERQEAMMRMLEEQRNGVEELRRLIEERLRPSSAPPAE